MYTNYHKKSKLSSLHKNLFHKLSINLPLRYIYFPSNKNTLSQHNMLTHKYLKSNSIYSLDTYQTWLKPPLFIRMHYFLHVFFVTAHMPRQYLSPSHGARLHLFVSFLIYFENSAHLYVLTPHILFL